MIVYSIGCWQLLTCKNLDNISSCTYKHVHGEIVYGKSLKSRQINNALLCTPKPRTDLKF